MQWVGAQHLPAGWMLSPGRRQAGPIGWLPTALCPVLTRHSVGPALTVSMRPISRGVAPSEAM